MQAFIASLIIIVGISSPGAIDTIEKSGFETIGQLPEIIVTTPRSQYDDAAWSGLLDTIEITALPNRVSEFGLGPMIGRMEMQLPWHTFFVLLLSGFILLGFSILFMLSHNRHQPVEQACNLNEYCRIPNNNLPTKKA